MQATEQQTHKDKGRLKALERMIERGDVQKFHSDVRHFKSVWGDADKLFGDPVAVLDKIKGEFQVQYPNPAPASVPQKQSSPL